MIQNISIKNFKCFKDRHIPICKLTVLTGYNAAGKSSVIQVLLLLAQCLRQDVNARYLSLNGPLVQLGSVGDIVSFETSGGIEFGISSKNYEVSWTLATSKMLGGRFMEFSSAKLIDLKANVNFAGRKRLWPSGHKCSEIADDLQNIVYISAMRNQNNESFPSPTSSSVTHADVGAAGEYAPWWYVRLADEVVSKERCHPNESATTVRAQIDAWLSDLFPGAVANAEAIRRTSLIQLQFKVGRSSGWTSPSNVGYGLSYVFPILVALICAKDGQFIIIDSPEAHLHPRAQSHFGRMLAHFSGAGLNLIVETHSDHVLSGIRLGVRDQVIPPSDVIIHFFSGRSDDQIQSQVSSLNIDQNGTVNSWPEGFFDQNERDLAVLSGWE